MTFIIHILFHEKSINVKCHFDKHFTPKHFFFNLGQEAFSCILVSILNFLLCTPAIEAFVCAALYIHYLVLI